MESQQRVLTAVAERQKTAVSYLDFDKEVIWFLHPGVPVGESLAPSDHSVLAAAVSPLQACRRAGVGHRLRPSRIPCLKGEITALVMPTNGVTNGPCNTSNPSNLTACLEDTAALTLSCVSPGQDAGVAPPGRRLPATLPPRQGNRSAFFLSGLAHSSRGEDWGDANPLRRQPQPLRSSAACSWPPPAKYPARSSSSVAG